MSRRSLWLILIGLIVVTLAACDEPVTLTPGPPPSRTATAIVLPPTAVPTIARPLPSPIDTTSPEVPSPTPPFPPTEPPIPPTPIPPPTDTPEPTETLSAERPAWQRTNLASSEVAVLARAPGNPRILYAGGDHGIYRSLNSGSTWMATGGTFRANTLAVAPSDPGIVYAGLRAGCGSGETGTLYRSTDGGATWISVQGGAWDIDVNPDEADHLVALHCDGVYKSTDGGRSWSKLPGTGLTNHTAARLVRGINNRKYIYAIYVSEGSSMVLQRTTDDAQTWQALPLAGMKTLKDVVVDPRDARHLYLVVYSGFYSSADAGKTWEQHNTGLKQAGGEMADPYVYPLSNLALDRITTNLYMSNIVFESVRYILRWNGKDAWELFTGPPVARFPKYLFMVNDPANPALLVITEDYLYRAFLR